ncbi:hypothetical protein EX30DRAFT_121550 [Ascodesmis nigricans]|uniref:Uncharacterized protein n=1 Tax=Ascodesmis nigricans TaxID=341454 RepID=A0A4V3SI80_9PEZI|nr:hypothetical protein EX30DRAFT_121550 [Ascodesmis nigricans]
MLFWTSYTLDVDSLRDASFSSGLMKLEGGHVKSPARTSTEISMNNSHHSRGSFRYFSNHLSVSSPRVRNLVIVHLLTTSLISERSPSEMLGLVFLFATTERATRCGASHEVMKIFRHRHYSLEFSDASAAWIFSKYVPSPHCLTASTSLKPQQET